MNKRVAADEVVDLWNELGPAGGAATPHIPNGSAPDFFAAFANASTAVAYETWAMPFWHGPDTVCPSDSRSSPR
jgi:hypothetical protein